jgi:hypothetical protein
MAVVEIQFKQQVFFDIIAAQIVRVDPPGALLSRLPAGTLIERVEAGPITFADGDVLFSDGELALRVPLTVHVTTSDGARAAGSLQAPVTQPVPCTVWLRLQGAPPADLRWFIARVEVLNQFIPIIAPPRAIPIGDLDVPVQDITLAAGNGVVAIRLATPTGGALLSPVSNRLGGDDWGQFIEGQVFADTLAQEMNSGVDSAAAGSTDPKIEVTSYATGHWDPDPPAAYAAVDLVAVDALPADIDVPVRVYAMSQLNLDPVLDRIELRTRVSWAAHDFVTSLSSGEIEVVEDEVSEAILDKLKPPPGQEELERGERHVVFRSFRPLVEPITSLFRATINHLTLSGSGVGATGTVTVYPPPVAHFTLEDQRWKSGTDCNARRWKTEFRPPVVHIFGVDQFHSLRFRGHPTVDPPGFWIPSVTWSGFGAGNQIAHVTFEVPPGGLKPPGQKSSGFIVTNMGVRWVDLGGVPYKPAPPADPASIQAYVINTCMAISDRWGMGVLNLEWLVDPPDLNLGMPPLREWTIAGTGIIDTDRIEVVAVGPAGERPLAMVPVERGAVFAQVMTDADETLQVRGRAPMSSAPPQFMQRWIVPYSSVSVGAEARELALLDGALFVIDGRGVQRLDLPAGGIAGTAAMVRRLESAAVPAGLATRVQRRRGNGSLSAPRTAGRGRAIAVLHRGMAVLGFAGPLMAVTEGVACRPTGV